MIAIIAIASLILGAIWRRWFGEVRPDWAVRLDRQSFWSRVGGFPFRIAIQVPVGLVGLFLLGLVTGEPVWRSVFDAGLAIGFMTLPISFSRRPFEIPWEFLQKTYRLPVAWVYKREVLLDGSVVEHYVFKGFTTYAEASQGAIVWLLAILL